MAGVNRFMELIERTVRMAQLFVPWMARIMWFMVGLIATSLAAFWSGVPKTVNRVADNWLDRAIAAGFPTRWDAALYNVLWIVAFAMIVWGWIILSYLTITVIRWIF